MSFRVLLAASCLAAPALALSQSTTAPAPAPAPFALEPLPYPAGALAPVIDEKTMTIHHGRHHKAYVDALNRAVAADPSLKGKSLEAIVAIAGAKGDTVRNNGGGHWNHRFFWETMTRPDTGGAPSPALAAAITKAFGSLDTMKAQFKTAGTGQFGSGWAWLIVKPDGSLAITATPNQDNPLMDVAAVKGTPILGNDVWEHAYYLAYQNRRGDYLDAWWRVVDWKRVSDRYAAATRR